MSVRQMAEALELAGVEVEQIISSSKLDKKVVVGLVTKVAQHPGADRLKLAEVNTGKDVVKVVCGAPNLETGQKVALALPGAVLPDGASIEHSDIRGQESGGMICSQRELAMGDDHAGILVLDSVYSIGKSLCDIEGGDDILDLTTAANRSDLQSVVGLAREVAAFAGAAATNGELAPTLKLPEVSDDTGDLPAADELAVEVKVPDKAPRYLLQKFRVGRRSATITQTRARLTAAGVRPIDLLVDTTNYVMLEYGQPLHAFDAAKVKLPITVRMADKSEKLVTLDGVERQLSPEDLIIADADGPIALAGVMGGQATEVTAETSEILLESASFNGATVRKTAVRHGLRSEASARFERGMPVQLAPIALARARFILQQAAEVTPLSGVSDSLNATPEANTIKLRPERLPHLLGMNVETAVIQTKLEKLGFEVTTGAKPALSVPVPWWRPDVTLEEDLVEEVARSVGYDALPSSLPPWRPRQVRFDAYWSKLWRAKAALRGAGLFDVITYAFVSAEQLESFGRDPKRHLKLKNPLSIEQAYLRSDLLPSLVAVVAKNVRYAKEFGLFEVSRVYQPKPSHKQLPDEPTRLGAVTYGLGYTGVKGVLDQLAREFNVSLEVKPRKLDGLHPARAAQVEMDGQSLGVIGELHPEIAHHHKLPDRLGYLELDFKQLLAAAREPAYRPISRFPAITRDIAVVLPEKVTWAEVAEAIGRIGLASDVQFLSDYYGDDVGAGNKSLAVRLVIASMQKTLTDQEADQRVEKIFQTLQKSFGAKPRT